METIMFDHFISYTNANNIDDYLEEYKKAGFLPSDKTTKHHPGLRNGFLHIGLGYVEFCWVEDEKLFAKNCWESDIAFRDALRPFGIGMITDDIQTLHDEWIESGYKLPSISSGVPRDSEQDAKPVWSFQSIPDDLLPGADCFALTYNLRPKDAVRKVRVAPNTTYAIAGVTFVSSSPEERANRWRNLLAPGQLIQKKDGVCEALIGPHFAVWMTPEKYHDYYGQDWKPSPHSCGEMAVLHILAEDINKAYIILTQGGRKVTQMQDKRTGRNILFVTPDPRDGFIFAISEHPIENWLNQRVAITGEKIEIESVLSSGK
ncbi:VOC family protein [candidate division WOR-3 bacterium]|nr:VOC family protein [candidate division WOR-3 bacterium]